MSYSNDQKQVYNAAMGNVEAVNRELIKVYTKAKENVDSRLALYRQQLERGEITPPNEPFRRQILSQQISQEIDGLYLALGELQGQMFVDTYESTYYNGAYYIEKAVNTEIPGISGNYYLNFPSLDTNAVRAALEKPIAGHTFSERIGQDKLTMQFRIKSAVAQVLAEGQTVQQLTKRLALIDSTFETSKNKAIMTSRTELLRAYSYGQDESRREAEAAGVTFTYKWSSTLDGKTREDHREMDGKQAAIIDGDPVFTLPDGSKGAGPRMEGLSAGESINCRCRRLDLPYGIEPTERVTKLPNGEWQRVSSNTTSKEWYDANYS